MVQKTFVGVIDWMTQFKGTGNHSQLKTMNDY